MFNHAIINQLKKIRSKALWCWAYDIDRAGFEMMDGKVSDATWTLMQAERILIDQQYWKENIERDAGKLNTGYNGGEQ